MGVEGEAVVGERVVGVGVPEDGSVDAGAFLGMGVPGEVLTDLRDAALEVVVVDGAGSRPSGGEAAAAAVVEVEAPPEDVLGAVTREAGAAGVGRGEVAAVDVEVARVVHQRRGLVCRPE